MKSNKTFNLAAGLILLAGCTGGGAIVKAQTAKPAATPAIVSTASTTMSPPRVFLLNVHILEAQRAKVFAAKTPDASLQPALARLERDAQKDLKNEILSIVTKEANPPSGNKHDYMSQAPYFWKNPKTADGFPYIRRDGERNPEIQRFPDHELMDRMTGAVERLASAYYFTGKEEYAGKAAQILRMWFLDEKTKMNPNLEYAQAIPGENTGRGIGIIETHELTRVVDAIGLLQSSKAWTKTDQSGLEDWFSKYLDWLMTSKNGRDEAAAKNNHGTIYDVQVSSYALFVGKKDLAKTVLEKAMEKRIAKQIEPDGRQPLELERTKSWGYSTMNLDGLAELAELGESVGLNLWTYQTADGRGIRKAIEFLYPYAAPNKKWPFEQIEPLKPERLYTVMERAASRYNDDQFKKMMATVPKPEPADRELLGL